MHLLYDIVGKAEADECQKMVDDEHSVAVVAPVGLASSSASAVIIAQTQWINIHSAFGAGSDDAIFGFDSSAVRFIFSACCQELISQSVC